MKILKRLLLIFILIIPIKVLALESTSDYIDINSVEVNANVGSVILKNITLTTYNNYRNTNEKGFKINASMFNGYDKEIELKINFTIYDINKNIIDDYEDTFKLISEKYEIYEKGRIFTNIESIKYLKVHLEILTDLSVPNQDPKENHHYFIEKLNNTITVTKDRHLIYDESIDLSFEDKIARLYRYIPVRHIYKINKIRSTKYVESSLENGFNKVIIKDKNQFEKYQNVKLSYQYNLGKDYSRGYDSVNVFIVDNYNAAIKEINFNINLKDTKNIKSIIFYKNNKIIKVKYNKNKDSITGVLKDIPSNTSIKMSIILKDKYFENTKSIIDSGLLLSIVFPLLSLMVTVIIVLTNKKPISKKLDIKQLENYSTLEVGYLYNNKLDNQDIISMLLSLASKGFLNIKNLNGEYILYKVKDYKGNNQYEKELFNNIFKEKTIVKEKDFIKKDNSFMDEIKTKIDKVYKTKFYNNFINRYFIIIILNIISLYIVNTRILTAYDYSYYIIGNITTFIIYIVLLVLVNIDMKKIEKFLTILTIVVFYTLLLYFVIIPSLIISKLYILIYVLCILCTSLILYLYVTIPKRKIKSNKLLKLITRLKKDIEDKNINRNDYYDLLPYTYAIDSYEEFIRLYNDIKPPKWYEDNETDYLKAYSNINTLLQNITYDLIYKER